MIEFKSEKPELGLTLDGAVKVTFSAPKQKLDVLTKLEDVEYDITIKQHREKRSLDANAYAWTLITQIADILKASKDEIYKMLLKRYGQSEIVSVMSNINVLGYFKYFEQVGKGTVNGNEFTHYLVFKGSSEFDTKEMSIFIDGIISEAQELNIDTRTPDEIAEMKSLWRQK